ncbi:uncharacterized protein LOC130695983 [Daphnia carinata]|uniref:uncharacterized protein LOC130695983 n=1 Tax=Daphnia carinata TaxID=120202 RepID=UPI00257B71FA|nr:uncharacterized protein LOC130695983 [Daphnia carinata]XP_059351489.1 uncharacterized protein LOC130695983 [Daphnia carinata]
MISSKKLLCNRVLMKSILSKQLGIKSEDTATITMKKKLNDSALKKWAIVSPLVGTKQLTAQLVTGIEVTPIAATWAVLDIHLNEVVDCGTYPLFSEDVKACSSVILDLVHRVKELIPPSDLFVLEEKLWTKGGFKSNSDMGINLLTFQAMLYTLLNENFVPDDSLSKVFYIQPKAILKLFKLKVGNERVSSQHIVQRMIRRSDVGYVLDNRWENMGSLEVGSDHYGQLSWSNPEMIKRIWTRDELWRENVSNAILAAHAFTDLCLKEDGNALRLLWKRA